MYDNVRAIYALRYLLFFGTVAEKPSIKSSTCQCALHSIMNTNISQTKEIGTIWYKQKKTENFGIRGVCAFVYIIWKTAMLPESLACFSCIVHRDNVLSKPASGSLWSISTDHSNIAWQQPENLWSTIIFDSFECNTQCSSQILLPGWPSWGSCTHLRHQFR